jgi:HIP---CoA ligase
VSSGIGGAPPEQEDPRADRIWGTVPRLVEDAALRHGDTEALVDGELRLTYSQLAQEVDRYARGFLAAGVGA